MIKLTDMTCATLKKIVLINELEPKLSTSNRIPTGGSSKKCSYIYFFLIVAMVLQLLMTGCTIVTSGYHGSIRTTFISNNSTI